jgi:hypothetical protein
MCVRARRARVRCVTCWYDRATSFSVPEKDASRACRSRRQAVADDQMGAAPRRDGPLTRVPVRAARGAPALGVTAVQPLCPVDARRRAPRICIVIARPASTARPLALPLGMRKCTPGSSADADCLEHCGATPAGYHIEMSTGARWHRRSGAASAGDFRRFQPSSSCRPYGNITCPGQGRACVVSPGAIWAALGVIRGLRVTGPGAQSRRAQAAPGSESASERPWRKPPSH